MAGRDERRGRDLDDWFGEPELPIARRARPNEARARADVASSPTASGDDWLGGGDGDVRPAHEPRFRPLGALSKPRLVIAAIVALLVLLGLALALSGVFSSATPRRAATATGPTHAGTTTAAPTATQPQSSPTTAAPAGPLKPGDKGSEVKVLQRALASLGYSPGAVDGKYGTSTQRAVTRFQSFSKLTPDGILGPQTLRALRIALKGQ
jgi:putative peptidoglycan binding protein